MFFIYLNNDKCWINNVKCRIKEKQKTEKQVINHFIVSYILFTIERNKHDVNDNSDGRCKE